MWLGFLLAAAFASLPWLYDAKLAVKLTKEFPLATQVSLGSGPYVAATVLVIGMGLVGYFGLSEHRRGATFWAAGGSLLGVVLTLMIFVLPAVNRYFVAPPQELAFVAAKHMAYYRSEHYVRVLFPTMSELSAIMLGAIKLVKPDQEIPAEAQQLAQELGPMVAQDPLAAEGLRKVVRVFLDKGGASNLKRWYQSVELTAVRAGFLMCGDLEIAKKMLALEPGMPGDVSPAEKLRDLVQFSISDSYFALREALGINFQSAAAY